MALKQHSFKLDLEDAEQNEINEWLAGKPTNYHVIEAMKIYVRIEKAKQTAIENMVASMQVNLFAGGAAQQAATVAPAAQKTPPAKNDDIEDFDM